MRNEGVSLNWANAIVGLSLVGLGEVLDYAYWTQENSVGLWLLDVRKEGWIKLDGPGKSALD